MPVDPNISLQGTPVTSAGATSPLQLVEGLSLVQNRMNQNALFQQQFAAKQRAGQILSSADPSDPEAGIRGLMADPQTAPFAGEIINNIRGAQHTLLQMQGERQTQAQSALAATLKGMGAALTDPTQLESSINAHLATTSAAVAPEVKSAIGSIVTSLGSGLSSDPAVAKQQYQNRLAGQMLAVGWTPEAIRAQTGTTAPNVSFEPVGPGGARVPVVTGGSVTGGAASVPASILGQASPASALSGGNPLAAPTVPTAGSAPAPAPALSGLTPSQQKYQDSRGADMAKYQLELDDAVKTGNTLMQTVQEARGALQDFKPGGGASTYGRIGQLAQAFGASDALVNKISNGDISASQEFGKIANNFVVGQLRQALQGVGGSRINQMEWDAFQKNNPNLDTDPRAIDKIFNFWTKQHNYNVAEQDALAEKIGQPGFDISRWPNEWQKEVRAKGLVNTSTQAAGGQSTTPAGGATHRWVPGQGLVPIETPTEAPAR